MLHFFKKHLSTTILNYMDFPIYSWIIRMDDDLTLKNSALQPAHSINWRLPDEDWIPAYWKGAGINSFRGERIFKCSLYNISDFLIKILNWYKLQVFGGLKKIMNNFAKQNGYFGLRCHIKQTKTFFCKIFYYLKKKSMKNACFTKSRCLTQKCIDVVKKKGNFHCEALYIHMHLNFDNFFLVWSIGHLQT